MVNASNAHLIAFMDALTTGQLHQFEDIVKTAYKAGTSREDLLTAIEIARCLADVLPAVLGQAYATVHDWHWIVARRAVHQRRLATQMA